MFPIPAGWRVERTADAVMLASSGRRIVVHEGLRPIAELDALVAAAKFPDFVLAPESVERLLTCEGEYALVATGRIGGSVIYLGFVLLDDSYMRVVGHREGDSDAVAEVVREIVVSTRAFLGSPRRRWFWYRSPPDWRKVESGSGDDTWLAPDYPHHRASITVPRALPIAARQHVSVVKMLLGSAERGVEPQPATDITTGRGLVGQRWTCRITSDDGVELEVAVAALSDHRYDYFARSIAPPTDAAVLAALLETIEPLPFPTGPKASDAMAYWIA